MSLSASAFFAKFLETLLQPALRLDPLTLSALAQLEGKRLQIELSGLNLSVTLLPGAEGILVVSEDEHTADVTIRGAPFSLLRLLLQRHATLGNSPDLQIIGDIRVVQQLHAILSDLDIDWEEPLARWLGDVPAHGIGTLFRQGQRYLHDRLHSLELNLREYVQEEIRFLPSPPEVENFLNGVDTLRHDVERLEQRIKRLQNCLHL